MKTQTFEHSSRHVSRRKQCMLFMQLFHFSCLKYICHILSVAYGMYLKILDQENKGESAMLFVIIWHFGFSDFLIAVM